LYNSNVNIIIDTSVVLAVVCGEASRDRAIELTIGHSLVAPSSLHWELGNALSAMIKRDRLALAQANACIAAYQQIPIKLIDVELKPAMALAKKLRMYAYDAYMLICAQQIGGPILTLDGALKAQAESSGIAVLEI